MEFGYWLLFGDGCLVINRLEIVMTSICKIPPDLPLLKGGMTPLW